MVLQIGEAVSYTYSQIYRGEGKRQRNRKYGKRERAIVGGIENGYMNGIEYLCSVIYESCLTKDGASMQCGPLISQVRDEVLETPIVVHGG